MSCPRSPMARRLSPDVDALAVNPTGRPDGPTHRDPERVRRPPVEETTRRSTGSARSRRMVVMPTYNVPAHPGSSGAGVSRRMSTLRRRDNERELSLRRALHAAGYRFRVTHPVPGIRRRTIDIAFTRRRVAVFLDGCFWHGCPQHGTDPRSNSAWWAEKIASNRARDRDTDRHLIALGWSVVRVWEHEDLAEAVERVRVAAGPPRSVGDEPASAAAVLQEDSPSRHSPSSKSSSASSNRSGASAPKSSASDGGLHDASSGV